MNPVAEEVPMKLLQIDSSARSTSVTRKLTAKFAEEWRKTYPTGKLIHRDLTATVFPLITDDWGATYLDPSKVTPAQSSYLATSDTLIEELQSADTVVIGAPMYNFSVPAPLKAWIDQIVRMGKTFSVGANGPQGLLGRKNVVVITSRGGAYDKGSALRAFDFQEPYLQAILGFIGLTDLTFVHAENQMSERAPASMAAAGERISGLAAQQGRHPVAL
jgi:FMN-dependent NADH-azoreductase